jgi:RNA-directed DNA polymerase
MTEWSPATYRAAALSQGLDSATAEEALRQAAVSSSRGLPAILTLNHLATMTAESYPFLRSVVGRRAKSAYELFTVRKRTGGSRLIAVPCAPLMRVQRWINQHVLSELPASPRCYSYAGRSIRECAALHCGARWLVKIDLTNFFETISEQRVYRVFRAAGYNNLVAFELARICTRAPRAGDLWFKPDPRGPLRVDSRARSFEIGARRRYSGVAAYGTDAMGHLPQGAPTSPRLSNLVGASLDLKLNQLGVRHRLTYTRYADDLAFSTGSTEFTRSNAVDFLRSAVRAILQEGFYPNRAKTRLVPPGARKTILGLLVDTDRPRLQKEFREGLDRDLYLCRRFGIAAAVAASGSSSIAAFKWRLFGRLAYANDVDPGLTRPLRAQFADLPWPV